MWICWLCPFNVNRIIWYQAAFFPQNNNIIWNALRYKYSLRHELYWSHPSLSKVYFWVSRTHRFSCQFVALMVWSKIWLSAEWRVFVDSYAHFIFLIAHFNFLWKTNQIKKGLLHHVRSNNAVWPKQGQITLRSDYSIWLQRHFPFIWYIICIS